MRSGRSGEGRPRCRNSSDRTAASSGTTTPRSCKERRLHLGSGSSGPSRSFKRQKSGEEAEKHQTTEESKEKQMGRER